MIAAILASAAIAIPAPVWCTYPSDDPAHRCTNEAQQPHPDVYPPPMCDPMPTTVLVCTWDPKGKLGRQENCPDGYVLVNKEVPGHCPTFAPPGISPWNIQP